MLNSRDEITQFPVKKTLRSRDRLFDLSNPIIMGILNCTPDSFYAASRSTEANSILHLADNMVSDGAQVLDVGGYSTRPGGQPVECTEELSRIKEVIPLLRKNFPDILLSLDTFRSEVAEFGLNEGVDVINDVTGGQFDEHMWSVLERFKPIYILMHSNGCPFDFHAKSSSTLTSATLITYFSEKLDRLKSIGLHDVILDPGFGFSKSLTENYSLLRNLNDFRCLGFPILAGISRKSMIGKVLDSSSEHALNGTTVLNSFALLNGAGILRVHDVKEAAETIKLLNKILEM
jgi:dihydropteroate synthase